jgi:hypothetical protein
MANRVVCGGVTRVYRDVHSALPWDVANLGWVIFHAVYDAVRVALATAVTGAVGGDPAHPSLSTFLIDTGADAA